MELQEDSVAIRMPLLPEGRQEQAEGARILKVKDYLLWSLFNFVLCNCCCVGLGALAASIKSRDRKVVGDVEGASRKGKTALGLNITAMILSLLLLTIFIALIVYLKDYVKKIYPFKTV